MSQKNILLIDDEEVEFTNLRFLLDDEIEITYKNNYDDAVSSLEKDYDLYIIDLFLSEKDAKSFKGLELIKKVRLDKENAKIIAISSLSKTEELVKNCSKSGADSFLSKKTYNSNWKQLINDFLHPPQILVIDDDSDVIEEFFRLTFNDYYFFYAKNLKEGEEIIKSKKVKLIILDLELDKNNKEGFAQGEENIRHLQKKDIPILILSANKDLDLGIKLRDMKMVSGYLNKNSYEPIEWKNKIEKAISEYINLKMKKMKKNNEDLVKILEKHLKELNKDLAAYLEDIRNEESAIRRRRSEQSVQRIYNEVAKRSTDILKFEIEGIPEKEKEELKLNLKEAQNSEHDEATRKTFREKAGAFFSKYEDKIMGATGGVVLKLIMQGLGL